MRLKLTNSLSKTKEEFTPLSSDLVKMYVCGPTVYDEIHIGNARSLVVYDMLYRLLVYTYSKNKVLYVRNITDVDDKINKRAQELNITIKELTNKFIECFHKDVAYLNCLTPNIEPKATEHIDIMINVIQKLLHNGCAYIVNGSVYFDVLKYTDYGKLSGRILEDMTCGTRFEIDQNKRNLYDFVLWKRANEKDDESCIFDSPWSRGRPGWHIECSSMSNCYLGQDFDIHGGGIDLIFPHHTNEIAQSCAAFPGSFYAKYWIHNGSLMMNSEKMSKSLNNVIKVKTFKDQGVDGAVLRYALMNTHYSKPLNFNDNLLHEAKENVRYLNRLIQDLETQNDHNNLLDDFLNYLLDDLNTHMAMNFLITNASKLNSNQIQLCVDFLGLRINKGTVIDEKLIKKKIDERTQARILNKWDEADKIRQDLTNQGIRLYDNKDGSTTWEVMD